MWYLFYLYLLVLCRELFLVSAASLFALFASPIPLQPKHQPDPNRLQFRHHGNQALSTSCISPANAHLNAARLPLSCSRSLILRAVATFKALLAQLSRSSTGDRLSNRPTLPSNFSKTPPLHSHPLTMPI